MANPSMSIDDETLAKVDHIRHRIEDELPGAVTLSRSALVQELLEDWVREHEEYLEDFEGNSNRVLAVAD